jgi:hypothetical protein
MCRQCQGLDILVVFNVALLVGVIAALITSIVGAGNDFDYSIV